jgi:hypothetical protein
LPRLIDVLLATLSEQRLMHHFGETELGPDACPGGRNVSLGTVLKGCF